MKKLVVVFVAMIGLASCEKESVVPETELPKVAQEYLSAHFEGVNIIQVVKDQEGLRKSFDVYLADGFELEFKKSGDVVSIKNNRNQKLPNSVVPAKILEYVNSNFAPDYVVSWELDDNFQEVELNTGMELKFSKSGDFIRID